MYLAFCVSAIVDILIHFRVRLPKYTDYVFFTIALATEGILFKFHAHGQSDLELALHSILIIAVTVNAFILLAESMLPTVVLVSIMRSASFLLHGFWLWQIAFVLYPLGSHEAWDNNHESVMFAVATFTWLGIAALCMSLTIFYGVGSMVNRKYKTTFENQKKHDGEEYNLLVPNGTDGM